MLTYTSLTIMLFVAVVTYAVIARSSTIAWMQSKIGLRPLRMLMWALIVIHWFVAFGLIAMSYSTYGTLVVVNTWYVLGIIVVFMYLMAEYLRIVDTLDRTLRTKKYTPEFEDSAARAREQTREKLKEFFPRPQP